MSAEDGGGAPQNNPSTSPPLGLSHPTATGGTGQRPGQRGQQGGSANRTSGPAGLGDSQKTTGLVDVQSILDVGKLQSLSEEDIQRVQKYISDKCKQTGTSRANASTGSNTLNSPTQSNSGPAAQAADYSSVPPPSNYDKICELCGTKHWGFQCNLIAFHKLLQFPTVSKSERVRRKAKGLCENCGKAANSHLGLCPILAFSRQKMQEALASNSLPQPKALPQKQASNLNLKRKRDATSLSTNPSPSIARAQPKISKVETTSQATTTEASASVSALATLSDQLKNPQVKKKAFVLEKESKRQYYNAASKFDPNTKSTGYEFAVCNKDFSFLDQESWDKLLDRLTELWNKTSNENQLLPVEQRKKVFTLISVRRTPANISIIVAGDEASMTFLKEEIHRRGYKTESEEEQEARLVKILTLSAYLTGHHLKCSQSAIETHIETLKYNNKAHTFNFVSLEDTPAGRILTIKLDEETHSKLTEPDGSVLIAIGIGLIKCVPTFRSAKSYATAASTTADATTTGATSVSKSSQPQPSTSGTRCKPTMCVVTGSGEDIQTVFTTHDSGEHCKESSRDTETDSSTVATDNDNTLGFDLWVDQMEAQLAHKVEQDNTGVQHTEPGTGTPELMDTHNPTSDQDKGLSDKKDEGQASNVNNSNSNPE